MSTLYTPPGSPYPKRRTSQRRVSEEKPLGPLYKPADHPDGGARPFRTIKSGKRLPIFPEPRKTPSLHILPQQRMGTKTPPALFLPDPDCTPSVILLGNKPDRGIPLTTTINNDLESQKLLTCSQIELCLQWPGYDEDFISTRVKSTTGFITTALVLIATLKMVRDFERTVKEKKLVMKDNSYLKWDLSRNIDQIIRIVKLIHIEDWTYQVELGIFSASDL